VSLYREARSGRRRLWIGASIAVVVLAAAAGVVLATTGGTQSDAEKLESLQRDVEPALAALELIPIHYASPNPTTHAAAADQLDVARDTIASVEGELETLDPAGTRRVLADLARLELLVRTTGQTDQVERATSEAAADLRTLVRLD
jgi:negative regulator of sigma E activity